MHGWCTEEVVDSDNWISTRALAGTSLHCLMVTMSTKEVVGEYCKAVGI